MPVRNPALLVAESVPIILAEALNPLSKTLEIAIPDPVKPGKLKNPVSAKC